MKLILRLLMRVVITRNFCSLRPHFPKTTQPPKVGINKDTALLGNLFGGRIPKLISTLESNCKIKISILVTILLNACSSEINDKQLPNFLLTKNEKARIDSLTSTTFFGLEDVKFYSTKRTNVNDSIILVCVKCKSSQKIDKTDIKSFCDGMGKIVEKRLNYSKPTYAGLVLELNLKSESIVFADNKTVTIGYRFSSNR